MNTCNLLWLRPGQTLLLALFICIMPFFSFSQTTHDAINLKTWIIKDSKQVNIPAPPGKEQTLKELKLVKEKVSTQNEKSLQQIKYWDAGSPSYRWNQLATSLISFEDFVTYTRVPGAWMNLAIYDATTLGWQAKNKYRRMRPAAVDPSLKTLVKAPASAAYPCEHSLTAAAAATVLAYFYPAKADSILTLAKQAADSRINAGLQFPSDVETGWKLGQEVANRIIEEAKRDGADKPWSGKMKNEPGLWRGDYPVGITTAAFRPIVLQSGDQFRPPPPPDFADDMKALKNFKQDFMSTYLAYYWASLSGFDFWTDIASQKIFEYRLQDDALACSRIYTLLNVAMHDAAIAIMDAKYAYWGIRPFQYDTAFKPLVETPPFPGYPSGHATASSTASTVLQYFFPADAVMFEKMAKECADSRFYAGIHFNTDNMTGLEMGKKLGNYVVRVWMKKE